MDETIRLNNALTHKVTFERRSDVADTASVFRFRLKPGDTFRFSPGQYAWLVLDHLRYVDSRGERRALSLVSSNQDADGVEFLVRASDSGFKRSLWALKAGESARIIGPFGSAYRMDDSVETKTFIVGGVAIAPFLGIVNSLTEKPSYRLRLVHFIAEDTKVCRIEDVAPRLKEPWIDVFRTKGVFTGSAMPGDTRYAKEDFYVLGPQGFVNAVNAFLEQKGVPHAQRHFEESYPQPPGNLTRDMIEAERGSLLMEALRDSKSHTVITDANGVVLYANAKAQAVTGYTLDEMSGNTPRLWGGLMPESFYRTFWRQKSKRAGFDGEITNRRKNGEVYIVTAHISPILSKDGTVIGYIGTEEDITLPKQQRAQLAAQNTELSRGKAAMLNILEDLQIEKRKLLEAKANVEAMFTSIGDGLVATDREGNVALVNSAFESLLGWRLDEIRGRWLPDVVEMLDADGRAVPNEDRPMTKALQKKATVNAAVDKAFQYRRRDGSLFPVSVNVSPVVVDGEVIGTIEVFRDVSHEKEIDTVKTEFVSLASHQLRTPLTSINWHVELLLAGKEGALTEGQKNYLHEIYVGSKRMVELVNALLNTSRLDLGTFMVESESLQIPPIVASVVDEMQPLVQGKGQTLDVEIQPRLPRIQADPKLLRIIFQNLISNAAKYTKEKGKIRVSVLLDKPNHVFRITVADNGIGIPKEQQAKIFTKLFRADNARGSDTDGTGLGLYIVKAILQRTGGDIRFESQVNKGTTFFVTLPAKGMGNKEGSRTLE